MSRRFIQKEVNLVYELIASQNYGYIYHAKHGASKMEVDRWFCQNGLNFDKNYEPFSEEKIRRKWLDLIWYWFEKSGGSLQ